MRIKKMTATFGGLERAVLEPDEGLTIITAPNETGKSTWAAFLRAMLYGVSTRERDREGYLAEKNRYAPWSGVPMEGELQAVWRGEEITLRRFARRASPFGGFEAVYTASGDPVSGVTADNVGELLTGAGRELYERTAFVGQGCTVVGGSAELERRITALATAGEEETSFTQAQRTLRDWLNRRRANRANGLLPQLDEELLDVRAAIRAAEKNRREAGEAQRRLDGLKEEKQELEEELELHRRIRQQELDRRYGQALLEWQEAEAAIPQMEKHPVFGAMTAEEAWDFACGRVAGQEEAVEENRRLEARRSVLLERGKKRCRETALWGAVLAAAGLLLLAGCIAFGVRWYTVPGFGLAALLCCANLLRLRRLEKRDAEERRGLVPVPIPDAGDILEQAASYRAALARAEQAAAAARAARRLVDELAAQGGREFTTLELLHPPARSMAETGRRLRQVEDETARNRRILDMARGEAKALGDMDVLYARLDELEGQRAERQREYDALTVALEALSAANDTLRRRFSPELDRQAGELFARLTGGGYTNLELTRTLEAAAVPNGTQRPRSALALSRGTVEQLYLAVRLAVCSMTLGGEEAPPLVLDDALASFDDRRMVLALELLRDMARERQVLLFTCHSREAAWAEQNGVTIFSLH